MNNKRHPPKKTVNILTINVFKLHDKRSCLPALLLLKYEVKTSEGEKKVRPNINQKQRLFRKTTNLLGT